MLPVFEKIVCLLDENSIKYEKIHHPPVVTSKDAAEIRDMDPSMGAKAILFIADGDPLLIVVPGDMKIDTKIIKREKNIKDLYMAKEHELMRYTGLTKGAVPPIGKVFSIRSLYDKKFTEFEKVAFNAGSKTDSVIMRAKDLIKLENPEIVSFAKHA